jgi:hypothetical protein
MRTSVSAASALAALAVAVAVVSAGAATTASPLLGIALDGGQGHLARLDADTLRPLRTGAFLTNGYTVAPALSPDGATLALGSTSFVGMRFVNVTSLRLKAEVRLRLLGAHVVASAWPSPNRLVLAAIHAAPTNVVFVAVDPVRATILTVRRIAGTPVRAVRTRDGLAVLLAPVTGIGNARLAVASATRLHVWSVSARAGRTHRTQTIPALTVDQAHARGYVITPGDRLLEIDLATGKTQQRALARRGLAKVLNGRQRSAAWLGNGLIALTGSNGAEPAGLELVDVRRATARMLDRDTSHIVVGGGVLVALGTSDSVPLRAYGFGGALRFEAEVAHGDWVQVAGSRAYLGRRVLELPSGKVLGLAVAEPRIALLTLDGSTFPL